MTKLHSCRLSNVWSSITYTADSENRISYPLILRLVTLFSRMECWSKLSCLVISSSSFEEETLISKLISAESVFSWMLRTTVKRRLRKMNTYKTNVQKISDLGWVDLDLMRSPSWGGRYQWYLLPKQSDHYGLFCHIFQADNVITQINQPNPRHSTTMVTSHVEDKRWTNYLISRQHRVS